MPDQAGTVYRYFRVDCDHDISGDTLQASLDTVTWNALNYIPPVDYPPSVVAKNGQYPPKTGFVGYWWQALTGPAQTLPLSVGVNVVYWQVGDDPESPHGAWEVTVGTYE